MRHGFLAIVLLLFAALLPMSVAAPAFAQGPKVQMPAPPRVKAYTVTYKDILDAKKAGVDVYTHLYGAKANGVRRFNHLDPAYIWPGSVLQVPTLADGDDYSPMPAFYPPAEQEAKYILVALNLQFMGLYEHGKLVASYPICSGKPGHSTPTLEFKVLDKNATLVSNKYPEPNGGAPMPWASAFLGTAYWFHGGDMVGYRASHGCVRMFKEDAEKLFAWDEIGTPGRIVDLIR